MPRLPEVSASASAAPVHRKRVGVIGAGASGLAVLKELSEKGHDAVAFEMQPGLGGVYRSSYENLTLTTSNANIAFGAHPPDQLSHPTMWSGQRYLNYLEEYAERFDLMRRIHFSTSVDSLYKDEASGKWVVETSCSGDAPASGRYQFDHVSVCSGVNARKQRPVFEGEQQFRGQILHSAEFDGGDPYKGRRVVVVGLGESGSDIALEIARVAEATAISTRKGPGYVIPRYFGGMVSDLDTNRCYHAIPVCLAGSLPLKMKSSIERWFRSSTDDGEVLRVVRQLNDARGLPWQRRFGTKNTAFIEAMLHYGALYEGDIARLEADRAIFSDGSEFECDTIICCTGFAPRFPFLTERHPLLAEAAALPRGLFKRTFHPQSGAELSWVGFVRPGIGSIPPCSEMQARYVALVLTGERALPARDAMLAEIAREAQLDLEQFPDDAHRLGALTDYMRFLDGLGRLIGCNPPLMRLFFTQPAIWAKVMFGPITGAQFRIVGPGATPEPAAAALRAMPTMPKAVIACEFSILLLSKLLSLLGVRRLKPTGF